MSCIKIVALVAVFISSALLVTPSNALFNRKSMRDETLYNSLVVLTKYSSKQVKKEKYLKRLIKESKQVVAVEGNRWLTPQNLLGLAIGESDLRWWIVTGKGSLYDCGICQNHTPIYARTVRERRKLCKLLQKSTLLSLTYAAHELNLYRNKYCLNPRSRHFVSKKKKNYKQRLYKCVFTLYNQGPNSRWAYNKYWLRILCFTASIEKGRYPAYPCRKMRSLGQLKYWMRK